MAQPLWLTTLGDLGIFPAGAKLEIYLAASAVAPAIAVTYKLLSGSLPAGTLSLSSDGIISGIPDSVKVQTTYSFTIRITDNLGNIKDGTFNIKIYEANTVKLLTPAGLIIETFDSEYVNFSIDYVKNTIDPPLVTISSGNLPPGLSINEYGVITGWPAPPVLLDKSPTSKEYTFAIKLINQSGIDSRMYSIKVINRQLSNIQAKRNPAILNTTPLKTPVSTQDEFYDYYLKTSNQIDPIEANKIFSFKILGYDFDNQAITYQFSALPPGLIGDTNTGWITGTPTVPQDAAIVYKFSVKVIKRDFPSYESVPQEFLITVRNNVNQDIEWQTDAYLGEFNNGTVCHLNVKATAEVELRYAVTGGDFPPNITLMDNGDLNGTFPFQPKTQPVNVGDKSTFTFDITAFSALSNGIYSTKTFTIDIYQRFERPVESLYFKATPNLLGRRVIQSLLTSEQLIPEEYLFRPNDLNFGKTSEVKIVHQYGIVSKSTNTYIHALVNNHYRQRLALQTLKTAIARDENGDVLYEVVYATVKDSGTNEEGDSVPKYIGWPQDIGLKYGEWYDSKTTIYTSNTNVYTSFSPSYVSVLYPTSLENMRLELLQNMSVDMDISLLPKWMSSQQLDGTVIGYIPAWVLCFTLPGKSEIIKSNIENYWAYNLSDIDFEVDRMMIDRSMTYSWNTNLVEPAWSNLPSATPAPSPLNQYDDIVLFQQQTILPTLE